MLLMGKLIQQHKTAIARSLLISFLLMIFLHSFSQHKEANIWYLGFRGGLDFNSGEPVVTPYSYASSYGGFQGNAVQCDTSGVVLFYSEGVHIYNRERNIMLNGEDRSCYFDFDKLEKDSGSYSRIYKFHNELTPVHKSFTIKILPDSIASELHKKMYVSYSPDNSEFYYISNKTEGNYFTGKSKQLGYYKVMMDTISPEIKVMNFEDGKNISGQHTLKVKISDKQTGIKTYRATLNDKWILMEYDAKKYLLTYNFDDRLKKGENNFKLVVTDMLDNVNEYSCVLTY